MDSLNQLEIQNIRHIYGMASTCCKKLDYYKTLTTDNEIISIFNDLHNYSTTIKNELSSML